MGSIRYLTAGESHGQGLIGIIEGVPAGLEISEKEIAADLKRRQMGHGRGGRMKIESDSARILSGVRFGKTLGSPISMLIENHDWKNWQQKMSVEPNDATVKTVAIPRPGHADLAGGQKYRQQDLRNILERASARETAIRVALGGVARKLLSELEIKVVSHVVRIHSAENDFSVARFGRQEKSPISYDKINVFADASSVRCLNKSAEAEMISAINTAKKNGDTVGGIYEVIALKIPSGLGSHVQWDRKLDGRIAQAMMSIPAMKAVEIGLGQEGATIYGSEVHDPIAYSETEGFYRTGNNAGGLEGGVTNGMPLVVRVAMKPIATLMKPLDSVNHLTKEKAAAHIERSDVCAVPAASVIGESLMCLVLADAVLEKFGGDSMRELAERVVKWRKEIG